MQNLILCSNFYNDIDSLSHLISTMEYEESIYGAEINNFNFVPQGIQQQFSLELSNTIEVQPDTGLFRKPNALIHFEPFYQHCLWLCIVALEDTTITCWEQEHVKSFFDIPSESLELFIYDNCGNQDKWTLTHQLNMKKNDFVFIRPWIWYSLTENKLVQLFLLNQRLDQEV